MSQGTACFITTLRHSHMVDHTFPFVVFTLKRVWVSPASLILHVFVFRYWLSVREKEHIWRKRKWILISKHVVFLSFIFVIFQTLGLKYFRWMAHTQRCVVFYSVCPSFVHLHTSVFIPYRLPCCVVQVISRNGQGSFKELPGVDKRMREEKREKRLTQTLITILA